jgi:hypothetical protein
MIHRAQVCGVKAGISIAQRESKAAGSTRKTRESSEIDMVVRNKQGAYGFRNQRRRRNCNGSYKTSPGTTDTKLGCRVIEHG